MKRFAGFISSFPGRKQPVSFVIIGICTILFLVVALLQATGSESCERTHAFLGLSRYGVVDHHWFYEFLTSPFLHEGVLHLVFNMLALWMLGPAVEAIMGWKRYLFFSASCAFAAELGHLAFAATPFDVVYGYSAVIYGILVAQAVYFPDTILYIFAFFPLRMRYAVLVLGAMEAYLSFTPEDSKTSHLSHLLGAAMGFMLLKFWSWRERQIHQPPSKQAANHPRIMRWRRSKDIPREL
jgi:membrane associated rhomboid family serine protease